MSENLRKIVFLICVQLLAYGLSTDSAESDQSTNEWPNHDISTLKLLQIVHRHGDRNPISFPPNDPYQYKKYWKEGIGELTSAGKYRMFKLGELLRNKYHSYLGDEYSPREVYIRSSLSHRCIESVSSLLAGFYPPKHVDWQWNNGSDASIGQLWQPFPIETYMPKKDDIVLRQDKYCPVVYMEKEAIYKSQEVQDYLKNKTELFERLSAAVGYPVDSIKKCGQLHTALQIEMSKGYYWTHIWPKEEQKEIVNQLLEVHRFAYRKDWNSTIIKRLRAGGLVKELVRNFESVVSEQNKKKVYIYSTHDSMLAALMHALNVFDGELPLFGSTLILELHQNPNTEEYSIRVFYIRDTYSGSASARPFGDCENKIVCPLQEFIKCTQPLIYEKLKKECNSLVDHQKYTNDDKLYFIR